MKFLMMYEASPNAAPPSPEKMAAIGAYSARMMQTGTVLLTGGLIRPTTGTKVELKDEKFVVTDGPFAETKELIDGFALIEVGSMEAAIAVAREFMGVAGDGKGEILQVFDGGEPPPG